MSYKYFKIDEFDCPHCGKNWIDISLIRRLDALREEYGSPITVTSGYRCEAHNKAVGGVKVSEHTRGRGADVSGKDLDKLYELCQKHFKAVGDGRAKGFVHVDLRDDKVRRWTY
jgi:uncharacterized protein YcbK (DUF882 family)